MAAVKTLRVQPTPSSPHHSHHSQELISPSSTYPSQSFSSPSSLSHVRLQAHYHHARQLQQQRLQLQQEKERLAGQQRVALWDTINQRKISGFASPLQKNLHKYIDLHPHCILYDTYLKEKERSAGGAGAGKGGRERRKKGGGGSREKKGGVETDEMSDDDEKSDDGSVSDSSDSSDSSTASSSPSSPSSSSSSADVVVLPMSPLPAGGKRKPSSPLSSDDSSSASGSGNDSDSSNDNDSMKTEDDSDSLPSTLPPSQSIAPTPPVLPAVTEAVESPDLPPISSPPVVSTHKPPPFSLSSLPFIPRLYIPEPNPLPSDPLLTSPTSPPASPPRSPPIFSTRAEPMSPPSPLSSVNGFSASEEEEMDIGEAREGEEDALEVLDRGHAIQAGPFPLGHLREDRATSLTPMVEALVMREGGGGRLPKLLLEDQRMED